MRLIDANKLGLHFNNWQLAEAPKDKTGHEPKEYTSHDMQLMIYRTIDDAIFGNIQKMIELARKESKNG